MRCATPPAAGLPPSQRTSTGAWPSCMPVSRVDRNAPYSVVVSRPVAPPTARRPRCSRRRARSAARVPQPPPPGQPDSRATPQRYRGMRSRSRARRVPVPAASHGPGTMRDPVDPFWVVDHRPEVPHTGRDGADHPRRPRRRTGIVDDRHIVLERADTEEIPCLRSLFERGAVVVDAASPPPAVPDAPPGSPPRRRPGGRNARGHARPIAGPDRCLSHARGRTVRHSDSSAPGPTRCAPRTGPGRHPPSRRDSTAAGRPPPSRGQPPA